ncbi:MAG: hypothetical protein ACIALR_14710 [Blastopirellula sp. JB062]
MLRPLLFSLIVAVGASIGSATAEAYFPYYPQGYLGAQVGYGGCGYNSFGGYAWRPYSLSNVPTPPYFALHPPVYYSNSVARPYGVSPFAIQSYRPSQRVVYSAPTPEPQVVMNPYVSTEAVASESTGEDATAVETTPDESADADAIEPTTDEDEKSSENSGDAAASIWPAPQVVFNPFVTDQQAAPVSFTKIVTPASDFE